MKPIVVNSKQSLETCQLAMASAWEKDKYLRVSWKIGKDRSLDQNALVHIWYRQIAHELQEGTPEDVECECKLRIGVAILRAADDDFRAMWDDRVKHQWTYEQKLSMMKFLPVTSLMTTEQMSSYMDTMQKEWARRGVVLESRDGL